MVLWATAKEDGGDVDWKWVGDDYGVTSDRDKSDVGSGDENVLSGLSHDLPIAEETEEKQRYTRAVFPNLFEVITQKSNITIFKYPIRQISRAIG